MNNSVTKLLNEIKVLDLSRHYSGDLTSMFLSDFGALVFKYINKFDEASYSENDFWHRNKTFTLHSTYTWDGSDNFGV